MLLSASVLAQTPEPAGDQFQVNTYMTNYQFSTAAATDPQGGFVEVWTSADSDGTDSSGYSIQGQRFSTNNIFGDDFESGDLSGWSSFTP